MIQMTLSSRILRFLIISFVTVLATFLALYVYIHATHASVRVMPDLKIGDIIFQTSRSSQSLAIMLASKSVYSHMGIIRKVPEGVSVIEAAGPVRETPIEEWIKRGIAGRVTVKRLEKLTKEQLNQVLDASRSYYGRGYDPFFYGSNKEIYCSELVRDAFIAAGLTLGKIQRIDELNIDNFAVDRLLKNRLKDHPLCKSPKIESFEECKTGILKQTLVTPQSIFNDKLLTTIYTNYW